MPIGTEIYKIRRNVASNNMRVSGSDHFTKIADLDEEGQEFRLAKGGRGGIGNY